MCAHGADRGDAVRAAGNTPPCSRTHTGIGLSRLRRWLAGVAVYLAMLVPFGGKAHGLQSPSNEPTANRIEKSPKDALNKIVELFKDLDNQTALILGAVFITAGAIALRKNRYGSPYSKIAYISVILLGVLIASGIGRNGEHGSTPKPYPKLETEIEPQKQYTIADRVARLIDTIWKDMRVITIDGRSRRLPNRAVLENHMLFCEAIDTINSTLKELATSGDEEIIEAVNSIRRITEYLLSHQPRAEIDYNVAGLHLQTNEDRTVCIPTALPDHVLRNFFMLGLANNLSAHDLRNALLTSLGSDTPADKTVKDLSESLRSNDLLKVLYGSIYDSALKWAEENKEKLAKDLGCSQDPKDILNNLAIIIIERDSLTYVQGENLSAENVIHLFSVLENLMGRLEEGFTPQSVRLPVELCERITREIFSTNVLNRESLEKLEKLIQFWLKLQNKAGQEASNPDRQSQSGS